MLGILALGRDQRRATGVNRAAAGTFCSASPQQEAWTFRPHQWLHIPVDLKGGARVLDFGANRGGEDGGKIPPLSDEEELARRWGVSPRLIRELWARRELGGVKVGRKVRFSEADIAAYIEAHHVEPNR
jgi:excisionase family DNA binding protein